MFQVLKIQYYAPRAQTLGAAPAAPLDMSTCYARMRCGTIMYYVVDTTIIIAILAILKLIPVI